MATSFILQPTTPITITADYAAEERPYVQQWFNQTKLPGESVNAFIRRLTIKQALQFRAGSLRQLLEDEYTGVRDAALAQAEADLAILKSEVQSVKDAFGT